MMLATKSKKSAKLPSIMLLSSLMLGGNLMAETAVVQSAVSAAKSDGIQADGSYAVNLGGQLLTVLTAAEVNQSGFRTEILNLLLATVKQKETNANEWPPLMRDATSHYKTLLAAVDDIQVSGEILTSLRDAAKQAVIEVDLEKAGILLIEVRNESLQADPPLKLVAAEADAANAARALTELKVEEAADYYLRASNILEAMGEKHHEKWSGYADSAGSAFREAGYYAEANSLLKTAFELRDKYAPGSPTTLESLAKLAQIKRLMAQYDEALPLYQRALAYNEGSYGEQHPKVAVALNDMADIHRLKGDYERALPLYQRALNINREKLGNRHPDFATTLNNLAGLYESTGEHDQALELYQEALEVNESTHGEDHPAVATTLNNLAGLYRAMGKLETALPLYERDLKISRKALGKDHPDVATTLNNLGILYFHMQDYAKSTEYLSQALDIFRSKLGMNHPNTVRAEESLLVIKQKLVE